MSTDAIIDVVVQTNLLTTGLTSSNSSANLVSAMSHTMSLSYQNAVANQQQGYITHQSAGVQGRSSMFATGLSAANAIVSDISDS